MADIIDFDILKDKKDSDCKRYNYIGFEPQNDYFEKNAYNAFCLLANKFRTELPKICYIKFSNLLTMDLYPPVSRDALLLDSVHRCRKLYLKPSKPADLFAKEIENYIHVYKKFLQRGDTISLLRIIKAYHGIEPSNK